KEGYDLSIRVTRLDDSSLIARPLANSQRVVCCSPDYAERHGTLDTLEQLMQHECLGYNNATPSQVWTFEPAFPGAKPRAVSPRGRFSSNNGQAMRDAALRGQGLALLPLFIVAEDLKNGRLVDAAPGLRPLDDVIYAMYSRAAAMSPKVKAFIQHLQQALSIPPWGNG
ncbi:substrate binding domain-containing protein, partial [Pseudomonas aeruginosa]